VVLALVNNGKTMALSRAVPVAQASYLIVFVTRRSEVSRDRKAALSS
jgi:hypothetical protein